MNESPPLPFFSVEESIRAATIVVLRERGWDGLTLERVAEVAGRARSTLWRKGLTLEVLIGALTGELERDFRASMYPILTSAGTGLERLEQGLVALCALADRHLPLLLATDEAFHQEPAPGRPPDYLHPFIAFIRDGISDGTVAAAGDIVEAADVLFNSVAWPYVHLRGRHEWTAERATARVVGLVVHGVAATAQRPSTSRKERS
ncbi:MAG: TetR/AcrR family transcriptional regulator [Actinobacteria bacterium]|nr:TetR/AcrR family transcriptional regulator [Actinomycetota bacterium]